MGHRRQVRGPIDIRTEAGDARHLLADRFHLKAHRETRELPVYRIEIAKGGAKLAPAKPEGPEHRYGTHVDRGLLDMRGADMPNLVFWLSAQLNQPILDSTGLTGVYDLKLEWNQDELVADKTADAPAGNASLSILSAMEVELGPETGSDEGPPSRCW
ncbi:MAG: TIGR03435 family protein [Ignavibacteriota bacterium]